MELKIRPPAVAGAFYPASERDLKKAINYFLEKTKKIAEKVSVSKSKLRALVVPHAGYPYSAVVAAAGFNLLKQLKLPKKPKVLLLGPSHNAYFQGLTTCSLEGWETPLGIIKVDPIVKRLIKENLVVISDEAHDNEHCLEVELPFLQEIFSDFSIIPLLTGEGNPVAFAKSLAKIAKEIDLFLISSDLSHYYPYNKAVELDKKANEEIPKLNIQKVNAEIEACGKQGILTLMHLAKEKKWQGIFVDYKNSGDTGGDKSAVVGYGCYAFYEKKC